jgi:uncharacterized small protein (TIGR04563 family)
MTGSDRRKQNVYLSDRMLDEIRFEAARCDRSLSWVVQKAWKVARARVMAMQSANAAPESAAGTLAADSTPEPTKD